MVCQLSVKIWKCPNDQSERAAQLWVIVKMQGSHVLCDVLLLLVLFAPEIVLISSRWDQPSAAHRSPVCVCADAILFCFPRKNRGRSRVGELRLR